MSLSSVTVASPNACVTLIGLLGAGKSTIGKLLAKKLQRKFVDSDHVIEARTGVSVREIFEVEGEAGFREREQAVVCELVREPGIVLATGGGCILREATRAQLREHSTVIYLLATPEEVFRRVGHDRSRPLLNTPDPLAKLRELFEIRDPLYREIAHYIAETHGRSPQALQMILQWLATVGITPDAQSNAASAAENAMLAHPSNAERSS
jgi:shikimate kinase